MRKHVFGTQEQNEALLAALNERERIIRRLARQDGRPRRDSGDGVLPGPHRGQVREPSASACARFCSTVPTATVVLHAQWSQRWLPVFASRPCSAALHGSVAHAIASLNAKLQKDTRRNGVPHRDLSTTPDFRRRRSSVPCETDLGREGTITPQHTGAPMSGRELFRQLNHAR